MEINNVEKCLAYVTLGVPMGSQKNQRIFVPAVCLAVHINEGKAFLDGVFLGLRPSDLLARGFTADRLTSGRSARPPSLS